MGASLLAGLIGGVDSLEEEVVPVRGRAARGLPDGESHPGVPALELERKVALVQELWVSGVSLQRGIEQGRHRPIPAAQAKARDSEVP